MKQNLTNIGPPISNNQVIVLSEFCRLRMQVCNRLQKVVKGRKLIAIVLVKFNLLIGARSRLIQKVSRKSNNN